jgi:hypothetical protein
MYVNMLRSGTMTYSNKAASGDIKLMTCRSSIRTPTAMVNLMRIVLLIVVFNFITPFPWILGERG